MLFSFPSSLFSLLTLASGSLSHTWRSWRTRPCVVAPRIVVLVLSAAIAPDAVLRFLPVLHFLLTATVGVVAPRIVVIVLSAAIASCLSLSQGPRPGRGIEGLKCLVNVLFNSYRPLSGIVIVLSDPIVI